MSGAAVAVAVAVLTVAAAPEGLLPVLVVEAVLKFGV